jgi:hypothetical protein
VRNMYAAGCGSANTWYSSLNSTKIVEHGSNSNAITQPLPQPACSRTVVNVVSFPIALNFTTDCLPTLASGGGNGGSSAAILANINSYFNALQNQGANADKFELQAAAAAKLNYYLVDDKLSSRDTVINLLTTNKGNMKDADIQLVFAYMDKGNYGMASSKANALGSHRADWKALLLRLITIAQEPDKMYSLNPDYALEKK